MKKTIKTLLKGFITIIIVAWVGLIVVEYFRYQDNKPLLISLKEETIDYEDGHVYIYWGLGYKAITYERTSIFGKEFGHLFIKVRDKLPNRG